MEQRKEIKLKQKRKKHDALVVATLSAHNVVTRKYDSLEHVPGVELGLGNQF